MTSLDDIATLLRSIKDDLATLPQRSQVSPVQIVIAEGLSDISKRLGLMQAGEFRAGNAKEPGFGFTGVRVAYPGMTYISETWNFVGVSNDVLQFGLKASDGKAYFAAGIGVIDATGITLRSAAFPDLAAYLKWIDTDNVTVGQVVSQYATGTASNTYIMSFRRNTSEAAYASLITMGVGAAISDDPLTSFQLQSDGQVFLNLENGTNTAVNVQSLNIKTKPNITNVINNTLYLDTNISGAAGNGLGTALVLRAKNSAGTMTTIGVISAHYTDVTAGSEDTIVRAWYMLAGVLTAVQIAP